MYFIKFIWCSTQFFSYLLFIFAEKIINDCYQDSTRTNINYQRNRIVCTVFGLGLSKWKSMSSYVTYLYYLFFTCCYNLANTSDLWYVLFRLLFIYFLVESIEMNVSEFTLLIVEIYLSPLIIRGRHINVCVTVCDKGEGRIIQVSFMTRMGPTRGEY